MASAIIVMSCLPTKLILASGSVAFNLTGQFESTLSGKHDNAGTFSLWASGSNVLIDVTYENNFREIVGTDGRDSFAYSPFSGDRSVITNANSIASISSGRFPTNANLIVQLLWLSCVSGSECLSNVDTIRLPFKQPHYAFESRPTVELDSNAPNLLNRVRWYSPGYMISGTNRYRLPMYPNGFKQATIETIRTNVLSNVNLPAEVTYTGYGTFAVTNRAQLREMKPLNRDDVQSIQVIKYVITRAAVDSKRKSYVPEILDSTTRLYDERIQRYVKVASGKWWTERELMLREEQRAGNRKRVILYLMCASALLLAYLVINTIVGKRNRQSSLRSRAQ